MLRVRSYFSPRRAELGSSGAVDQARHSPDGYREEAVREQKLCFASEVIFSVRKPFVNRNYASRRKYFSPRGSRSGNRNYSSRRKYFSPRGSRSGNRNYASRRKYFSPRGSRSGNR